MTIPSSQQQRFKDLYAQGKSMRAISRSEKVSTSSVKKYLLKLGTKIKTQNRVYQLKKKDGLLIGTYCGIWAGDGTQYYDKGFTIKIACHSDNKILMSFIQSIIFELFGKKTHIRCEERHRGLIIFKSKFIYHFVQNYLSYDSYKTKTIRLKKQVNNYSARFITGFLLGLTLSDGYLNKHYFYSTISKELAKNIEEILRQFNTKPSKYVQDRTKYGWNDLWSVYLNKKDSNKIRRILDKVILEIDAKMTVEKLKNY